MKWVSYTRSISSRIGEENPSNTIAEQNERIARYLKKRGCSVSEKYSDRRRTAEATEQRNALPICFQESLAVSCFPIGLIDGPCFGIVDNVRFHYRNFCHPRFRSFDGVAQFVIAHRCSTHCFHAASPTIFRCASSAASFFCRSL